MQTLGDAVIDTEYTHVNSSKHIIKCKSEHSSYTKHLINKHLIKRLTLGVQVTERISVNKYST